MDVGKAGRWKKCVCAGLVLVVASAWFVYSEFKLSLLRHQQGVGSYAEAFGWFRETMDRYPVSIEELEHAYNNCKLLRVHKLPVDVDRVPIYRGVPENGEGVFLAFVEKSPPEWRGRFYRFVVYAYANQQFPGGPEAGIRTVFAWNVDDVIAEDDAKRAALKCDNEFAENISR